MFRPGPVVLALPLAMLLPAAVHADAVIRTQAMLASTIAEVFVDEDAVRVELEIGARDLGAFRDLLPDDIHRQLGLGSEPMDERLGRFFAQGLVVGTPEAGAIRGRLLEIGPATRVRRDEITGEPLPPGESEPETVVLAKIEFPLDERPERLTIGAPGLGASIGFVTYHGGIAVNDFRYLGGAYTLELDWNDPWYTRFEGRNLRRAYFAPMSGFLYVEPYEVRKEIIARPKDLQRWVDLGLSGRSTIPIEMQEALLRTVAEFLRRHHAVVIDGRRVEPDLAQINFLERTLKTSRVIDPPEELDVDAAVLGAIFVYPTDGLPEEVTMEWDLFDERIRRIPAASVDQAGPFPSFLEPGDATLVWQNFLKNPQLPSLVAVRPPPGPLVRSVIASRWVGAAAAGLLLLWALAGRLRGAPRWRLRLGAAGAALAATAGAFAAAAGERVEGARAGEVVSGLLHNVYRAFDFRDEERTYDLLARSVSGDLLARIYLETRRGLELANQGGARAKVKDVELLDLHTEPGPAGGFVATATWDVRGSVGHWGHLHQRSNRYRARLAVAPRDGEWKLSDVEILEEERL